MRSHTWIPLCLSALLAAACKPEAPPPPAKPAAPAPPPEPAWLAQNPVVPLPKAPLGSNADFATLSFKVTPEKVRLGRFLFFDERLSADATVACATCHRPDNAFSEPTPHSTGIRGQQGSRKAPTFVDEAWTLAPVFFWDGRASSLQDQAKGPMANPIEMGNTHPKVVATVSGLPGYRTLFRQVYGDDRIDIDRVADAIAAYEATRLDGNSRYDRWEAGDKTALTSLEQKGLDVFRNKGRCAECHITGANFSDAKFHNLGIGWSPKAAKRSHGKLSPDGFADRGRYQVTHEDADIGAFKTPTLRDVDKHAPYMHDGSLPTLEAVVDHYDKGGTPNPWLDSGIAKLQLTPDEKTALVAFLKALDGEGYQDRAPVAFP